MPIILLLTPAPLIFRPSYGPVARGVERNAEKCNKSHPLQTIKVQRSRTVHDALYSLLAFLGRFFIHYHTMSAFYFIIPTSLKS